MEHLKYPERFIRHTLSAPFIYSVFFGFVVLDIFIEIYHRICFPLYGLELIDRNKYIKFDRHKLPYLNPIEKLNCTYCSYGNGLVNYIKEIVAQTEKYWCGIQSEKNPNFISPEHHKDFLPYGDEKAFFEEYSKKDKKCKLFD
ncbi:MAG: hypothetical protein PHE25_05415 [Candidatus Gracilibacteria bacterium]|nr:hypothetical protein [Candidatus Gracilibacteria bacterium]